mgnify:CR=1 FL=1
MLIVMIQTQDQDFKDVHLQLGPKREPLMKQIEADSKFLQELDIMDYSLLVGIHYRQRDLDEQEAHRKAMVLLVYN